MAGFTKREPSELQLKRQFQKACDVLEFERGETISKETVLDRWRGLVKKYHPDVVSGNGLGEPEVEPKFTFDQLRVAKDYAISYLERDDG